MKHYVWTRLAVDTASINARLPERKANEHDAAIRLWHQHARLFYEHQTVDADLTVVLTYSPRWRDLVLAYRYPGYVRLTTTDITGWIRRNVPLSKPVTLTRCDADDSYSTDWLEMLEHEMHPHTKRTHLLYYMHRQYDYTRGLLSAPLRHKCPQFSSVYFPVFPALSAAETERHLPGNPLFGLVGNHGRFPSEPHVEAPGCYALLRVTGFNAVNCWGTVGRGREKVAIEAEADPRFVL